MLIIVYVAVLIISMVVPDKKCERTSHCHSEIWYLFVRVLGLALAVTLITVGILNQNTEREKLLRYPSLPRHKNPLPTLWVWIAFNTVAQVGNVIESLVFTLDPSLNCEYSLQPSTYFNDGSSQLRSDIHHAHHHVLLGNYTHAVDLLESHLPSRAEKVQRGILRLGGG